MLKEVWLSHGRSDDAIEVEPIVGFEVDRLKSEDGTKADIGLYLKLEDRHVRVRLGPMLASVVANAIKKTIRAIVAEELVARAEGPDTRPKTEAEDPDAV